MIQFVKKSALTKMIALITCVAFVGLIVSACNGHTNGTYGETTTYEDPPPPPQYQPAPSGASVINTADPSIQADANQCLYRTNVPLGGRVMLPSGRICTNRDGIKRLAMASSDRSLRVPRGGSATLYSGRNIIVPSTPAPKVENHVEVEAEGCDTVCKVLIGLGAGALVTLAIFLPIAAEKGWFDSGNGDTEVTVQARPMVRGFSF